MGSWVIQERASSSRVSFFNSFLPQSRTVHDNLVDYILLRKVVNWQPKDARLNLSENWDPSRHYF